MIFHDIAQNSEEWEAVRLGKATSSNNAKIMAHYGKGFGEPAERYALQLALERVTGRKAGVSFKNDDMERGHEQEPIARMLYEEQSFSTVNNGGFFDWGEWGDSPDGLVSTNGVLEVKCVIATTHEANIKRGKPDPAYRWQTVGHFAGTNREWVDWLSYCSDYPEWRQLVVFRVWRGEVEKELAMLAERRAQFLELVRTKEAEINRMELAA